MADLGGKRQVVVRVDAETHERWTAAAKREGESLNAFIQRCVDRSALPAPAKGRKATEKSSAGGRRARTELCVHRRTPEQFCSRCDA